MKTPVTASSSPWLELDDDLGIIHANKAGLELLTGAINAILNEGETTINVDGCDVFFREIQLQEHDACPPPAAGILLGIIGWAFLTLFVSILGLAAFGAYQLFHLIFPN